MEDRDMIAALEAQEGSPARAARAVDVTPQTWNNWKSRGFSSDGHLRAWLALRSAGRKLLAQWADERSGAKRAA